jgi:4-hydroxythreonine-4-phosphate dehydrogenase
MKKQLTLAITPGDPRGIGTEVTQKALIHLKRELNGIKLVIFSKKFRVPTSINVEFIEPTPIHQSKTFCGWAIESASKFVMDSPKDRALVTGPIHKVTLRSEGYAFNGHTDLLAHLCHSKQVTMVLANPWFKVALATNHCPIQEVSKKLSPDLISSTILQISRFCRNQLGIKKPKIAVLGLNPHAGEEGILGQEEAKVIIPGMKKAMKNAKIKNQSVVLTGPHPADSFFAIEKQNREKGKGHDFILAMYHDQGLIPVKLSDFSNALNMTLGLPFIRTSVDHGTAFDIAGKNKADPGSMIYAIRKALEFLC